MARRGNGLLQILLALLVCLPLAGAAYVAANRVLVEQQNQQAGLVVDGTDLREVLAAGGQDQGEALHQLAARKLLVALPEDTVGSLLDAGKLTLLPGQEGLVIATPDAVLAQRVRTHLSVRLAQPIPYRQGANGTWQLTVVAPRSLLDTVGVGLPPAEAARLAQAGVGVVARLRNYRGVNPRAIPFMVSEAARQGARAVVFEGDEVLGYPRLLRVTARALLAQGVLYGSVEFAKQRGDAALGRRLQGALLRVHSITAPEMGIANPREVRERFVRAVRERNIRLCYLRSYTGSAGTLAALLADCDGVARGLQQAGYTVGTPGVFPAGPELPRWLSVFLAIAPAAAAVLLLGIIIPLSGPSRLALLVLALAACAAAVALAPGLGAKLVALLAAVIFPSLGMVLVARRLQGEGTPGGRPLLQGLGMLGAVSLVSLAGGLLTASLLSGRLFFVKVDQFAGIKLANLLPLLLLAVVGAGRLYADGVTRRQWWQQGRARLAALVARPVLLWELALVLAAAGALALFVARTGNEAGVGVSGIELRLRALLEQLLPARPRTKELFIGHPAFMLAVAMAVTGHRRWLLPTLLVAMVGQVSLVNTFCHLHTPLLLSLVRTATGLIGGALVGTVAVWVWLGVVRVLAKRQGPEPPQMAVH